MSNETKKHKRQWITLGGSSCDVRIGRDVIEAMGTIVKGSVGKPRACALVLTPEVAEDVADRVRYQLSDGGFLVTRCMMPAGPAARTFAATAALAERFCEAGITSDDLVCAMGDVDMLSAVSYVSGSWCGGAPLAQVPLDLAGCVEAHVCPRGIDVGGARELVRCRPATKYQFCDPSLLDLDPDAAGALYARAVMVSAAMTDGEKAFGTLWDRAELLAAGDEQALCDQLADTSKSRGRVISNTSLAVRQSLDFGLSFLHALRPLVDAEVPDGLLIAEGMRFLARISCGMELFKVDDVLTLDEICDLLELPPIACEVEPERMVEALKAERFRRSNRFLLELPRGIGRVRLGSVEDDLLLEHAKAWCASRASLV